MKLTVAAVTLFGLALASPTPVASGKKLAWREANWEIAVKFSLDELARQPEDIQGTWLYCSRFDGPPELWPEGKYTSSKHCQAAHSKAAWVPANPFAPCDRDTGYTLENCGTVAYCMQYDVERDRPVPALFEDSRECSDFYESGPTAESAE